MADQSCSHDNRINITNFIDTGRGVSRILCLHCGQVVEEPIHLLTGYVEINCADGSGGCLVPREFADDFRAELEEMRKLDPKIPRLE